MSNEDYNQLLERVINHVFETYDTDNCSDELLERIVDAVMEKLAVNEDPYERAQKQREAEIDKKNADNVRMKKLGQRVKQDIANKNKTSMARLKKQNDARLAKQGK